MSDSRMRSGGFLALVALAIAGLAVVIALGGDGSADEPLDPRSHARLGTSALVALIDELGTDVAVTDRLPDRETDVFLLLTDLLDDDQHDALAAWVRSGGTLVVVDPGSVFAPPRQRIFFDAEDLPGSAGGSVCDIAPLDDLDVWGVQPRRGGVVYEVPLASASSCLGDGDGAYIVATSRGAGAVVAIGGSGMVVNAALAEGENAAVMAALVAPRPDVDVAVLRPGPVAGSGERDLVDLISPNVRRALVQLVVAFVVYALWRARRLGAVVREPQPVAVAGSELVVARGSLLDRTRSPQRAAELLRGDLRRALAEHLGVPVDAPPDVFAAVAAQRIGVDAARVARVLGPEPIGDDDQLVALTREIDAIRHAVLWTSREEVHQHV
jgi:hypothetical protein